MQQAKSSDNDPVAAASGAAPAGTKLRNEFVINLCAATSPVGLTPPDHAGLKRYTFFLSRRREEGRERFRLHMGYFATQEEAERLLDIVREIYPGAWAGLAPGQRLRAQALAQARSGAVASVEKADTAAAASAAMNSSVTTAPPDLRALPAPPASAIPASVPAAPVSAAPANAAPASAAPRAASDPEQEGAVQALSSVRAAIASLEDNAVAAPTLRPLPELKVPAAAASGAYAELSLVATGAYPALAARAVGGRAGDNAAAEISDAAALRVLEPSAGGNESTVVEPPSRAASGRPDAADVSAASPPRDERAAFAVQLLWSVQPIDLTQIPQLAIFSAYTLYGAEGNRDGRRWYGVRLGFFTDAVSAKQVAHYVRSDFSTVSVVPVTVRERERAKLAATRPIATPVSAAQPIETAVVAPKAPSSEFVFIEDKDPTTAPRAAGARAAAGPPGKRAKLRPGRQVNARTRVRAKTLEETLEILGAGQLEVDDGRGPTINDSGSRRVRDDGAKGAKSSRIGRLLERLSERLGG